MRKLYILDEINDELYSVFTRELDELIAENAHNPIEVEISSQGGSAYTALAICGRLTNCGVQIHATAYGTCMSAAMLILACADKRSAAKETWFLVHDSKDSAKGTASQVLATGRQSMREEFQWAELLSAHTGTPEETWLALSKESTYLSAETAESLGLVDKILQGKKDVKNRA